MAEIDKNILTEAEKNQKVEVFVKRDGDNDVAELDLMRVFSNMGRKKGIYIWIMLLFLLIGFSVPMLITELTKDDESVSTVISFMYPGAATEKAPDGTNLNVRYISSSYILQKAIKRTNLSENIPISAIERNITIERLLNETTKQNLEVIKKVTETSKDSKDFAEVLNVDYKYEGKYIITLSNGFSTNPEARKKTYLPGNELSVLLNNIVESYNEYFFDTYSSMTLPENHLDSIINTELDYIERLDEIIKLFNRLSAYCTDSNKGKYLTYRSKKDGMSFADINRCIKLVRDIDVDYLYSYIFANNITKGSKTTVVKYEYNLVNTERELNSILSTIENNKNLINGYKNDTIAVSIAGSLSEDGASKISSSVTDYYNSLIINQSASYRKKADVAEEIDNLNYKINGFKKVRQNSTQLEYIENEMENLVDMCITLFELTKNHAEEIIESVSYKNSYLSFISAQNTTTSLFDASNIKKLLIGMIAGLLLAVFIWGMDGLIEELKSNAPQENKA